MSLAAGAAWAAGTTPAIARIAAWPRSCAARASLSTLAPWATLAAWSTRVAPAWPTLPGHVVTRWRLQVVRFWRLCVLAGLAQGISGHSGSTVGSTVATHAVTARATTLALLAATFTAGARSAGIPARFRPAQGLRQGGNIAVIELNKSAALEPARQHHRAARDARGRFAFPRQHRHGVEGGGEGLHALGLELVGDGREVDAAAALASAAAAEEAIKQHRRLQ